MRSHLLKRGRRKSTFAVKLIFNFLYFYIFRINGALRNRDISFLGSVAILRDEGTRVTLRKLETICPSHRNIILKKEEAIRGTIVLKDLRVMSNVSEEE